MPKFTGDGYDKAPFSEGERASHREMRRVVEDDMVEPDSLKDMLREWTEAKTVLLPLAGVIKSGKTLAGVIGVCAALGAAVAWAVKQGWLQ